MIFFGMTTIMLKNLVKRPALGSFYFSEFFCLISFTFFLGKKFFILDVVCVLGLSKSQVLYDVDGLNDS